MSVKRLKEVKESVEEGSERQKGCCVKHMCEKCEQTVNCWIEEADRRERRAMQKELAGRREEKKVEKCEEKVNASYRSTNNSDISVSKHAPPAYPHYTVAELQAMKMGPDLDCSPPKKTNSAVGRTRMETRNRGRTRNYS